MHTPEPWRVEPLQWDHGASIAIVGGTDEESYVVATIAPENEEDEPDAYTAKRGPCDEENAVLMMAAPKLLRALRMCAIRLAMLVNMPDSPLPRTGDDFLALELAEDAIKDATLINRNGNFPIYKKRRNHDKATDA